MMGARVTSERRGCRAETLCVILLRLKGYRNLARRLRSRVGEIDILARRRGKLVAVEVKARATIEAAAISVSGAQQARIVRAVARVLAQFPQFAAVPVRFDVMLVAPGRLPRHLRNAFSADGA